MSTTVQSLAIKSPETIAADYKRTYRNALIQRGIANPDVSEGTLVDVKATALAQQIYAASNNVPLVADAQMPDSAQGDDLVRIAKLYKQGPKPAGPSSGETILSTSLAAGVTVAIPTGAGLIDPSGNSYTVKIGGLYADGDSIPITSVAIGSGTNLGAGTVLRWTAPPSFVSPTSSVGLDGLTGGRDAETIEELRLRVLDHLQNPPNGVNWPAVVKAGNESSTAVQQSFTYQACNGPSTQHVAAVRAPTSTDKGRDIDAIVMATEVVPGILAVASPEFVETIATTVQNLPTDVAFGLGLPSAITASPQGPGGGWIDATPFPVLASPGYVAASVVTDSAHITVASDSAPVVGCLVCWISRSDWKLYTAPVASFTGSGPYALTLATPLVDGLGTAIVAGDYVFPASVNGELYLTAALALFASMGPGEKTDSPALLPRALRRPLATSSYPSTLNRKLLRYLIDSGEEIEDASYLSTSPGTTPPLPTLITDAPWQIVPQRLGFYPLA